MTANGIDAIEKTNRFAMRTAVGAYTKFDGLEPAEENALREVSERVRGGRILDLGVGGGRTVDALLKISSNYVGVDYIPEMVAACKIKFPHTKFEFADARSMPKFEDKSFDLIVFSWAGICMVDHIGRITILNEVRRLLKKGGFFIFSSYNKNSPALNTPFELPALHWTTNPLKMALQLAAFSRDLAVRVRNRLMLRRHEIHTTEYSIINDKCHDYHTMLYYISLHEQSKQLSRAGFSGEIRAYDSSGQEIIGDNREDSILYLVEG